MDEHKIQERFLKDVRKHKVTIIRESGVDRHIRYREPGTICYGFDIITWPGHLCISGDCGTYVFARTYDMFNFFMCGHSKKYPINTGYWHEKVLAQDRTGEVERFSEKKFNEAVLEDFRNFAKYGEHTPEQIREIWADIKRKILNPENEHDAYTSVWNYSNHGFQFDDFYEHDLKEYTFSYLWCLHAIVWGIKQYEKITTDALRDMNRC